MAKRVPMGTGTPWAEAVVPERAWRGDSATNGGGGRHGYLDYAAAPAVGWRGGVGIAHTGYA